MLFLLIFFQLLYIIISRKWSIEALLDNVKEWNYLNDPEELISDKKLGPKIHTNYLKINHVYDKTDINLFYLSDVIEKYIYRRKLFVQDLYEAMLNSTSINKQNMKKHHLFIVIFTKHKECIIFGSSKELNRLLPPYETQQIEFEIKKMFSNRANTSAHIVYAIFEKLQELWKKHTVKTGKNVNYSSNRSNLMENLRDIFYFICSTVVLGFFTWMFCCRKKKHNKND